MNRGVGEYKITFIVESLREEAAQRPELSFCFDPSKEREARQEWSVVSIKGSCVKEVIVLIANDKQDNGLNSERAVHVKKILDASAFTVHNTNTLRR